MTHLLTTNDLTVQIADKKICQALHCTLEPGDIWGILGANGSGKTTLLHTLAGLIPATSGDIFLETKNLTTLSAQHIARRVAILFQETSVTFPQTVFEFCLQGRYPHLSYFGWEKSVDKKIVLAALAEMELETKLSQSIQTLSGGEKRRLAIATLLAQTPKIYLLDEPTNHLDLRHQISVLNHFKKLSQTDSVGIVMALHDINLAHHYCNKILMLFDEGEILFDKTDVLLNPKNLSRLYRHPIENNRKLWLPQF
ncbi:MAG: ABC transporter ATP-binding protein [Gammaproteobacteria bacterium]